MIQMRPAFKQLFCRHRYQLFANIYGDLVNDFNARTVFLCTKCHKRKYIKKYIEAPVNYNLFLHDCVAYKETGVFQLSPNTIKDKKQYDELFGIKEIGDIWNVNL